MVIDEKLLQKIREMADDEDWKVRERAASEIKNINDKAKINRRTTDQIPVLIEQG